MKLSCFLCIVSCVYRGSKIRHFSFYQMQISLLIFIAVSTIYISSLLPTFWRLFLMFGVWLSVSVFLCLLSCFNIKMYFLQSLSHESPTNASWIDANLTHSDLHFTLLFIKHKNKECADHDNVYTGPLCVSPWHFEVEVALKCSKIGVLCCFCIYWVHCKIQIYFQFKSCFLYQNG